MMFVSPTFPPRRPKEGYSHQHLKLLIFKEEGSDEWKLPRPRESFDPNECRLNMPVRPGSSDKEYSILWCIKKMVNTLSEEAK